MKESITDRINKAAVDIAKTPAPAVGTTGEGVAKHLAATSGKAVGPEGTGQSAVGEAVAGAQTQAQQGAIAAKLRESAADMSLKEDQAGIQSKEFEAKQRLAEKQLDADRDSQIESILGTLRQSERDIEAREDALQLEIAGTLLAAKNKNYVENLQRIGKRNRLDDKVQAKREAVRLAIGDNKARLLKEMEFSKSEGAKSRGFKEANLIEDIDAAEQYVQAAMQDQIKAQKIGAATGAAKAAWDGYQSYDAPKKDTWEEQEREADAMEDL